MDQLRSILGQDDFIYMADSKLCTRKNLQHIDDYGGRFVTLLPRTRSEDKDLRKYLREGGRTDGVFPLVTNLKRNTSKKDVLLIYKYQPYVEKRHALLKNELEVAPVYIKKPQRAAGLIHATFLAMTLDALIERTVRQEMMLEGIESLPILPEGRPTGTPTTARILVASSSRFCMILRISFLITNFPTIKIPIAATTFSPYIITIFFNCFHTTAILFPSS